MKSIVITGSTRGIGFGLANAFLDLDCAVMVNGRSQSAVDKACQQLAAQHGQERLLGCAADVAELKQVEALWQTAVTRFGRVDIWINNAGLGHDLLPLWELPPERVKTIIEANVLGMMYGSRVAVRGMLAQGFGQLYNMQGAGSNGRVRWGMSVYSASKAAVHLLTQALVNETRETAVQVGFLSPGMVVTDLLVNPLAADPDSFARSRRIFNILSDRAETVAPFLAQKMLANDKTGASIKWLPRSKIFWRFLTAPFSKRDPFGEQAPS